MSQNTQGISTKRIFAQTTKAHESLALSVQASLILRFHDDEGPYLDVIDRTLPAGATSDMGQEGKQTASPREMPACVVGKTLFDQTMPVWRV